MLDFSYLCMMQIVLDPQEDDKTSSFVSRIISAWQNKLQIQTSDTNKCWVWGGGVR